MTIIRTVLGDKKPEDFQVILPHEHTVFSFLGAETDHKSSFDREKVIERAATQLKAARESWGISAIVDAAPLDLGRDTRLQTEVSGRSGVAIIASTGLFTEALGFPSYWRQRDIDALEDFFTREITQGVVGTGVKCGVIKLATGPGFIQPRAQILDGSGSRITPREDRAFRAAARAQKKLGVAIITHTEPEDWAAANIGQKQLAILEEEGADLSHCMIGHVSTTADLVYLEGLLRRGVNIGFDTIGLNWAFSDDIIAAVVVALVVMGYERQLLLSHDRYCMEVRRPPTALDPFAYPSAPDPGYIHREFIPKLLKGGVSEDAVYQMTVVNPKKMLAF